MEVIMCENEDKLIIEIGKIAAKHYKISFEDLCYKTRKRDVIIARQMAHTLSRWKTTKSTRETIGRLLGNKDNATVLHSERVISDLCQTDKSIKKDFEYLLFKVNMITYIEDFRIRVNINQFKQLQRSRSSSIRNKQTHNITYLSFC